MFSSKTKRYLQTGSVFHIFLSEKKWNIKIGKINDIMNLKLLIVSVVFYTWQTILKPTYDELYAFK